MSRSRIAAIVVVSLLATACTATTVPGGSQPTPQVIYVTPPPASPTPSASVDSTATPEPTDTATPEPTSSATQGEPIVHAVKQSFSSGIWVQIVLPVKNTGTTWINIDAGQSDYTIYDKSGGVLGTGSFTYAYPTSLAPGQTGYYADTTSIDGAKTTQVGKVDASSQYKDVSQDEAVVLTTGKVKNHNGTYGDNPTSTGTITNSSTVAVDSAHVGAFYFDGSGRLLGFSTTNLIDNLGAGRTKGFETLQEYGPAFGVSQIRSTVVLAGCDFC